MLTHSNLSLQLALALHQERIARAESWRRVARTRPVGDASAIRPTRQEPTTSTLPGRRFRDHRTADLGAWLTRTCDIVVQFPIAELDGHRRHAFGALVDALLDAAREGGADVPLHVEADDPAVVLLRKLGRLATYAGGGALRVSRRRSTMLRAALDELIDGSVVDEVRPRADAAA